MPLLSCPFLGRRVPFTKKRRKHILRRHPDLIPPHESRLAETLRDPDRIQESAVKAGALLFIKWYNESKEGRHVVVVVDTDPGKKNRSRVVTAYMSRTMPKGETKWEKK